MIFEVYLQVKRTGRTHAHVPDWPGCNWVNDSPQEAMGDAAESIVWHLNWLRKYAHPAPQAAEPVIARLAQQHTSTAREGNLIGFFESERKPILASEISSFLELMASARLETLEIVQLLPHPFLTQQPTENSWSILEILRHVADAERWYLTRILDRQSLPIFKPNASIWGRLQAVRELAVQRLSGLSEIERCQVIPDQAGELWSARKVFRRYVEHEREHTHQILEVLSRLP